MDDIQKPQKRKKQKLFSEPTTINNNDLTIEENSSKILLEKEALKLENYMLTIANKKMQSDNILMQITNKKLMLENAELKEQIEKFKLDKIKNDIQFLEAQKENNQKQVSSVMKDYDSYKKMLEDKYTLAGKWGFNPETFEIMVD
jgi:hypothetical protein